MYPRSAIGRKQGNIVKTARDTKNLCQDLGKNPGKGGVSRLAAGIIIVWVCFGILLAIAVGCYSSSKNIPSIIFGNAVNKDRLIGAQVDEGRLRLTAPIMSVLVPWPRFPESSGEGVPFWMLKLLDPKGKPVTYDSVLIERVEANTAVVAVPQVGAMTIVKGAGADTVTYSVTIGGAGAGAETTYTATIAGGDANDPPSGATLAQITTALVDTINAGAGKDVTASSTGAGNITLTADIAGTGFTASGMTTDAGGSVSMYSPTNTNVEAVDAHFTKADHGLTVGDQVTITNNPPGGFEADKKYYVVSVSGDNFTLSDIKDGTAITATSSVVDIEYSTASWSSPLLNARYYHGDQTNFPYSGKMHVTRTNDSGGHTNIMQATIKNGRFFVASVFHENGNIKLCVKYDNEGGYEYYYKWDENGKLVRKRPLTRDDVEKRDDGYTYIKGTDVRVNEATYDRFPDK